VKGVQRIVLTASRSEPIGKADEVLLVDSFQYCRDRLLDDLELADGLANVVIVAAKTVNPANDKYITSAQLIEQPPAFSPLTAC
jgi:hypothetical protein